LIIKFYSGKPTTDFLKAMKSLAVIAVATGVVRVELVTMRHVDFTDSIIRDVLIAGIKDQERSA